MTREARRRTWFGLLTLLGLAERGVFIPYRHAAGLPASGRAVPYPAIEAFFRQSEPAFRALLLEIDGLGDDLAAIGSEPAPAPRWTQDWFPRLDAAASYALVRSRKPKRIVEVGSGHSTRFLIRAARDGGLSLSLSAIDPQPRARFESAEGVRLAFLRSTLQEAGLDAFAALEPGDVLFIDSSHLLLPGSDVDILLGAVLPGLPAGVLLHIHDIFLPDDYPAAWRWRAYNEQQGVLALLAGGGWEPLWASHYVATRLAGDVASSRAGDLPLPEGALESSLWLRKTAPPLTQPARR